MAKKPKKPKKPKQSASVATWENFADRVKAWEKRCREIDSDKVKKKNLIKKFSR
jgi:hypothetical protein